MSCQMRVPVSYPHVLVFLNRILWLCLLCSTWQSNFPEDPGRCVPIGQDLLWTGNERDLFFRTVNEPVDLWVLGSRPRPCITDQDRVSPVCHRPEEFPRTPGNSALSALGKVSCFFPKQAGFWAPPPPASFQSPQLTENTCHENLNSI